MIYSCLAFLLRSHFFHRQLIRLSKKCCNFAAATMVYTGLPAPQSGHYTIHFRTEDILSGISGPTNDSNSKYASSHINDLQGRRLMQKPTKGVYIQDGKKVVVR